MKETTEKDFEDFRDSVSPEQDVITPIMEEGICDDYVIAIPEYVADLGLIVEDACDQNGGEILEIGGNKDAVIVKYLIDFYNNDTEEQSAYRFEAFGKLVKNDENQVMFKINEVKILEKVNYEEGI